MKRALIVFVFIVNLKKWGSNHLLPLFQQRVSKIESNFKLFLLNKIIFHTLPALLDQTTCVLGLILSSQEPEAVNALLHKLEADISLWILAHRGAEHCTGLNNRCTYVILIIWATEMASTQWLCFRGFFGRVRLLKLYSGAARPLYEGLSGFDTCGASRPAGDNITCRLR